MHLFIFLFNLIATLVLLPLSHQEQYLLLLVVCVVMGSMLKHYLPIFVLLFCSVCFFLITNWQINKQNLPFLHEDDFPVQVLAQGKITSLPKVGKMKTQARFHLTKMFWQAKWQPVLLDLSLSWYGHRPALQLGQQWQLMLSLKPYHALANPNDFNQAQWFWEKQRKLHGHVKQAKQNQLLSESRSPLVAWRQAIWQKLQALPISKQHQALLSALAIGYQASLSQQDWQVLRDSGTAHLFAISGLHVGMVALLCAWLSNVIGFLFPRSYLFIPKQKINAFCAFIGVLGYGTLAGWGIPVQRATIMLSLLLLTKYVLHRRVNPWYLLNSSYLVIVLFDPLAPLSAGFELSFFSVAMLLFCFGGRVFQLPKYIAGLKVHVVMFFALLPLLIYYWQLLPLFSIIANIVAVPIVTLLIVPLVLLACIVLPFSHYIWLVISQLLGWLWFFLEWLTHFSIATWQTTYLSISQFFLLLLAVLLFLLPKGIPGRWLSVIFLMPLFITHKPMLDDTVKLIVFDVGQGLAVAIQTQHSVLIYDTGAKFDDFDMAKRVIIPYLKRAGVKKIDTVVLSHADNDHSGGFESLANAFPIDTVYVSDKRQLDRRSRYCIQGEHWETDGVDFQFIYPGKYYLNLNNNSSCVLRVTVGEHVIILPGDIEAFVEKLLVQRDANVEAAIFIVPHHGSLTSSTTDFIKKVKPQHAVFSVGYLNHFSHPAKAVVQRYRELNTKIWRTDQHGAIIFYLKPGAALQDPVIVRNKGKF